MHVWYMFEWGFIYAIVQIKQAGCRGFAEYFCQIKSSLMYLHSSQQKTISTNLLAITLPSVFGKYTRQKKFPEIFWQLLYQVFFATPLGEKNVCRKFLPITLPNVADLTLGNVSVIVNHHDPLIVFPRGSKWHSAKVSRVPDWKKNLGKFNFAETCFPCVLC